jgi:hypothetical protein
VRSWLKDSGYPLEMRTAAAFRAAGLETEVSRYYVAEDGETLREIDVVAEGVARTSASSGHPWLQVVFVVECKASRAQPWVAFVGDQRFTRDEDALSTMRIDAFGPQDLDEATGVVRSRVDVSMVRGLHHAPLLYCTDRLAYGVTETGGTGGGKQQSQANAYNAVRQVTSAVDGYARDSADKTGRPVLRVTVPIVVTSAPLVTCRLDGRGSEVLEEVERVLLVARLRPAASLSGVWIVRDSSLDRLAADARQGLERLSLDTSCRSTT